MARGTRRKSSEINTNGKASTGKASMVFDFLDILINQKVTMRLPLAFATVALLPFAQAGTDGHTYKKGEHVELWVNKVRLTWH